MLLMCQPLRQLRPNSQGTEVASSPRHLWLFPLSTLRRRSEHMALCAQLLRRGMQCQGSCYCSSSKSPTNIQSLNVV